MKNINDELDKTMKTMLIYLPRKGIGIESKVIVNHYLRKHLDKDNKDDSIIWVTRSRYIAKGVLAIRYITSSISDFRVVKEIIIAESDIITN